MDLDARLTVLGSLNMDISVTVPALPEPGATVLGGPAAFAPGGKGANQAVAAARLGRPAGIRVRMVGCVGDDDFGRALRAALAAEGVDDHAVRTVPGAPTGIAMITVDEAGENIITVSPGANHAAGSPEIAVIGGPSAAPGSPEVLVISAEVPVPAIRAALAAAGAGGADGGPSRLTVLNLAPAPPRAEAAAILGARPDWLVVNESEAAAVLGCPVSGLAEAASAAAGLVAAGARNAVVTAGAAGAAFHGAPSEGEHRELSRTVAAFPVRAVDTVGAGDTFVGALAVALAAGVPPVEAVTAAAAAGAAAAARPGTQTGMPRPADVRAATGYQWPLADASSPNLSRLPSKVNARLIKGELNYRFVVNLCLNQWRTDGVAGRGVAVAPGLARFIADSNDPQTWEDIMSAVLAALAAEFTVTAERGAVPAAARRATWLDTFDWRLHKAGLTLQYLPGRGGSELRLSGQGAAQDVTQLVTNWQPSRPQMLAALAYGQVGTRIGGIVAPRALIPVVTTATVTAGYRLLNEDDKTVARLFIDQPSVVSPRSGPGAGQQPPVMLPPRLAIAEVRGYPGPARRAARLVAAVPGVRPAAALLPADALAALGRRPGDYSNKVDAAITADMPAAAAGAAILLRLLDTVEANLPGTLADIDTEFLHDLRVGVRRTRSALKLFGDALAGLTADEVAFFAAEFKWVGDLTTPTRDLDVHLLDFEETARGLAAAKPDDLEPFRAYLEQRRRREFRLLVRGLRSARFTALTTEWRARLVKVQQDSPGPKGGRTRSGQPHKAAGGSAGLLAAERTRLAFAKVARRGAAITPDTPAEALHDLRKRCKELRYALEFFAPLHDPAGYAKVVGDLKRLQDCLGEFQDTEVQIAEIRTLGAAMLAAREAPAVTLLAMGEITASLAARQRAARADFERRFAGFADVEGQRRMSALLRGRFRVNADLRDVQHQGRRRQDDDSGQPGLPGRRVRAAHRAVGPGPAGRGELHVPGQAEGQGRRPRAHQRQAPAGRRDQGH